MIGEYFVMKRQKTRMELMRRINDSEEAIGEGMEEGREEGREEESEEDQPGSWTELKDNTILFSEIKLKSILLVFFNF